MFYLKKFPVNYERKLKRCLRINRALHHETATDLMSQVIAAVFLSLDRQRKQTVID